MFRTTIKIDGMMCPMCEAHVNGALRKEFPEIKKIRSSHSKGETVIISENEYSEDKLREILDPSGYKVISSESIPYNKKLISIFGI